jgi:hypothetical protein
MGKYYDNSNDDDKRSIEIPCSRRVYAGHIRDSNEMHRTDLSPDMPAVLYFSWKFLQ